MKKLKNKKTKIAILNSEGTPIENAKYSQIIELCVNQPPINPQTGQAVGFGIDDIRKRLRLVDNLNHPKNGHIEMEDADYQLLCDCVTQYKWNKVDQMIVDFVDDVNNANQ
ncbi:MAG TPA: hypothetical protein EYN67_08200 [Flavobacteriales bacterium]|nr:hypothetical protein [Flavobacteriales bacterium]HIB83605.1 hypothetical protein [Chromatiaceae bacterium]